MSNVVDNAATELLKVMNSLCKSYVDLQLCRIHLVYLK